MHTDKHDERQKRNGKPSQRSFSRFWFYHSRQAVVRNTGSTYGLVPTPSPKSLFLKKNVQTLIKLGNIVAQG
jgi:hypothetical protein